MTPLQLFCDGWDHARALSRVGNTTESIQEVAKRALINSEEHATKVAGMLAFSEAYLGWHDEASRMFRAETGACTRDADRLIGELLAKGF